MVSERQVTHYVGDSCPGGHRDERPTCIADSGTCATCGHEQHFPDEDCAAIVSYDAGVSDFCDCPAYVPRPCGAALVYHAEYSRKGAFAVIRCERGHTAAEATA